jgi:hypothetical protein
MNVEPGKVFDPMAGVTAIRQQGEQSKAYGAIVVGILAHWIWELAVAAVQTGQWEFGNGAVVVARVVIAFIVGAVSFAGIWKQIEKADPKIRLWIALTQGFAVDALASPIANP